MWEEVDLSKMNDPQERMIARSVILTLLSRPENEQAEVEIEYPVAGNLTQLGVGDIRIVTHDRIIVIETKHIDFSNTGKTATTKRTKHRKKVREQCLTYVAWNRINRYSQGKRVIGMTATNENGLELIVDDMSFDDARARVIDALEKTGQPHVWGDMIAYLEQHTEEQREQHA